MAQNISKYVQINDFLLLEYEFNRDLETLNISNSGSGALNGNVATTSLGTKQYYNANHDNGLGVTNNILELNATPTNTSRSDWFNNYNDINYFYNYFSTIDTEVGNETSVYRHDNIKLHIISGYNFDDIAGFLLQLRAEDASSNYVDLSNFMYLKQPDVLGSADVVKFSSNTLYLGNRFYDKYIELQIPSVQALGEDTAGGFDSSLGQTLNVKPLSDVFVTYSTVPTINTDIAQSNTFNLVEELNVQLPVVSNADNFNVFIAESTNGDFIEFYGTWNSEIIGQYMGDIESGRIPLYTSNNPNDNYEEFTAIYGEGAAKWVMMHELYVYEQMPNQLGGSSLLSQKYTFTQDDAYSLPNYFRPVLKNADISASYTIQYVCRLSNRMDGSQIIRRASFASMDPKKYGIDFTRLNVDNIIPYKVFNKIVEENPKITNGNLKPKVKYTKIYYDTTKVIMNEQNEIYPQGTGPLFLKNGDSVYKFKFEKLNSVTDQKENVDLSGAYNYALLFVLDDDTKIEALVYYSTNMNTTIGEIDFKLTGTQIVKLLKQTNNKFSIIIKNADKTEYTFYEGVYYSYGNKESVMTEFTNNSPVSKLNSEILKLKSEKEYLISKNNELQSLTVSTSNSLASAAKAQTLKGDTSNNS